MERPERLKLIESIFGNSSAAPNFVSSFAHGDYVYFTFRETAVEYMNCGKVSIDRRIEIPHPAEGGGNPLKGLKLAPSFGPLTEGVE